MTIQARAKEYAETAYNEVTVDPIAYGIDRKWRSVSEWVEYELEGDSVNLLKREFSVSYETARSELIEALRSVADLERLNHNLPDDEAA